MSEHSTPKMIDKKRSHKLKSSSIAVPTREEADSSNYLQLQPDYDAHEDISSQNSQEDYRSSSKMSVQSSC